MDGHDDDVLRFSCVGWRVGIVERLGGRPAGSGSGSGTWWCVAATTPTTKDFNWQTF